MSYTPYGDAGPKPERHMANAVFALVLAVTCGWFLGLIPAVVAIVKAASVNERWAAGEHERARTTAESGVSWATASYALSALGLVGVVVLRLVVLA